MKLALAGREATDFLTNSLNEQLTHADVNLDLKTKCVGINPTYRYRTMVTSGDIMLTCTVAVIVNIIRTEERDAKLASEFGCANIRADMDEVVPV